MLDTDVDRARVDDLRELVERQKRESERERIEALERDLRNVAFEATGERDASENVLRYLAVISGE